MTAQESELSGWSGGAAFFQVQETAEADLDLVLDVLHRRRLGVVIRGYADTAEVEEILRRFQSSPAVRRRATEAASDYLGAYHYQKPPATYLDESAEVADEVARVLEFDGSPWRRFWEDLAALAAKDGVTVRPAAQDGRDACHGLVRTWVSDGEFALVPHDDAAQCRDPRQAGFEIGAAADRICAVNLCLANSAGGRLVVWDVIPDEESRARLGTSVDGGPYPLAALAGRERIALDVRPGDLYVFNSGHVHAVEQHQQFRATAANLMGFIDDETVVRWT